MTYQFEDKDLLELWMYFQDRATSVKGAMFNTITWILGFAAALLGFIFAKLGASYPPTASVTLPFLVFSVSGAGILLCVYALFALRESARHIENNWRLADAHLERIPELKAIVYPRYGTNATKPKSNEEVKKRNQPMKIWNQLCIIVVLFLSAFALIIGYAMM
jgi:uncharacterized membrane protein YeaQ/YmgE (transglycosylase-associated protein family)